MSKGSQRRPGNSEKYRENYDEVFNQDLPCVCGRKALGDKALPRGCPCPVCEPRQFDRWARRRCKLCTTGLLFNGENCKHPVVLRSLR
jgi:hypothetical protein